MADGVVTRFAPSPSGFLHIGHAYSALFAWQAAVAAGGKFVLRIEDIDGGRCKPHFEDAIYEDLAWLGIKWEEPVRRQSEHMEDYAAALSKLKLLGLSYPCFCTRGDIKAELSRMGGAPHERVQSVYPGICRNLSDLVRQRNLHDGMEHAIRLRMAEAVSQAGTIGWRDLERGTMTGDPLSHGDVILARKDIPTSYHLAVTIDDALQGVTLVTRGEDLLDYTDIHRVLQELLGLPEPVYHHHKLLTDDNGRRYAKRDRSLTIRALRVAGVIPTEVMNMVGLEAVS
jgi:glutamyl-Q tRNA(Asp) synthetase